MRLNETMYAVVRSDGTVISVGEGRPLITQDGKVAEDAKMDHLRIFPNTDLRVIAVKLVEVSNEAKD